MVGFPAVGELTYGEYTFDGTARIKVESHPMRDEAQRTVIYRQIIITVTAIVGGEDDSTDVSMESIRRDLSEDGKRLIFRNKGFGNLSVNSGSGVNDIKFGPKTEILHWEPIGSSWACEISWRVVVNIPECESVGMVRYEGVMAINYQMDFDIAENGRTIRTVTGYLEIAQSRKGNERKLQDTADSYRNNVEVNHIPGFRRRQRWSIDYSKSRLNFVISDQEIDSATAFPPGIVDIQAQHRSYMRSPVKSEDYEYKSSFSMSVVRKPGVPRIYTWNIFRSMVSKRASAIASVNKKRVFLDTLEVTEDIFSQKTSFRASFYIVAAAVDIIKGTGQFIPYNFSWRAWNNDIKKDVGSNRGTAGMRHNPSEDSIVDLCGQDGLELNINANLKTDRGNKNGLVFSGCPPRNSSYIRHHVWVNNRSRTGVVAHKKTQEGKWSEDEIERGKKIGSNEAADFQEVEPSQQTEDVVFHEDSQPIYMITLSFDLRRVCYPIPKPSGPIKWGGKKYRYVVGDFWNHPIKNATGGKIFRLTGSATYVLENTPGKNENIPNDPEGVSANGEAEGPSD